MRLDIIPFSMLEKYFASHFCQSRGPGLDRSPLVLTLPQILPEHPLGLKIGLKNHPQNHLYRRLYFRMLNVTI